MSTVVYQELQSCYESNNFVESRQLSLKLTAPKNASICNSDKPYNKCSNPNIFSWSSIEAMSNVDKHTLEKPEAVYIHPLVKSSSSKLSQKSLEMCTESLGCETGTCIMESSVFFESTLSNQVRKPRSRTVTKKDTTQAIKRPLPPPLTSITGSNPIQVKPTREHGRLIIKAVPTPLKRSCFQAERSNGRLTLTFVEDCIYNGEACETSDNNEHVACKKPDNNYNYNNDNDLGQCIEVISKDELEVKEHERERERKHEEDVSLTLSENMNDVKIMLGGKVRIVKIQTTSRCIERGQGNKRLVHWEPFWVVT